VTDGLGGIAQVLGLVAMLGAGGVDDPVGFQAGTGPVHGGDPPGVLVHAQVHEPVFMLAVEVADELPGVGEASSGRRRAARAIHR
jgi:hypothetical protein